MSACGKAQVGSKYFSAVSSKVKVDHSAYMSSSSIINRHVVGKKLEEGLHTDVIKRAFNCRLKALCSDT